MQSQRRITIAAEIMRDFAGRTGLTGDGSPPKRYLWTDAFAVCNFLELTRQTGDAHYGDLARRLVGQVHDVLGRHRSDDPRRGWLSGLSESEGAAHPTRGGLRIGKVLPERRPDEPVDEQLEWERDGQYYHYLTKWMLALNRLAAHTGSAIFNGWALELARTAHAGFTYLPPGGGRPRMFWKMSIDLSRPLVTAMGHHDPLDGLLTFLELQARAAAGGVAAGAADLADEIRDLERMCAGVNWLTDDPLGIGGVLSDALRAARLMADPAGPQLNGLLADLLDAGAKGLASFAEGNTLEHPAACRLAFRELGLAIGLHAASRIEQLFRQMPQRFAGPEHPARRLQDILRYLALGARIEDYWRNRDHQCCASWIEHRDINEVMLATCLAPDGYFG